MIYTIVYRKGGQVRFHWRRSIPQMTEASARGLLKSVRAMGVEAHAISHPLRVDVPLPGVFTIRYKANDGIWTIQEWEDVLMEIVR